jgi:chromosome segregation ATPase
LFNKTYDENVVNRLKEMKNTFILLTKRYQKETKLQMAKQTVNMNELYIDKNSVILKYNDLKKQYDEMAVELNKTSLERDDLKEKLKKCQTAIHKYNDNIIKTFSEQSGLTEKLNKAYLERDDLFQELDDFKKRVEEHETNQNEFLRSFVVDENDNELYFRKKYNKQTAPITRLRRRIQYDADMNKIYGVSFLVMLTIYILTLMLIDVSR